MGVSLTQKRSHPFTSMLFQVTHQLWQHPGDRPGRHQVFETVDPPLVGLLSNTPWPIRGINIPALMVKAAQSAGLRTAYATPEALCRAVFQDIHQSLKPFVGAAASDSDEDWEATHRRI